MPPLDFAELSEKRKEWVECLNGNDRNSIRQQIVQMTWNVAAYRMVIEARRLACTASDGGVELNGMVNELLDQSFAQSHMIAIRRLTDTGELAGKKGVYSLGSLIRDIKSCRETLTRENVLKLECLPYDITELQAKEAAFRAEKLAEGTRAYHVPATLHTFPIKRRHQDLDRLCGVRSDARQTHDTIQEIVLNRLQQRLDDACNCLKIHVDKFIAHSATPGSREIVGANSAVLTYGHLWEAHQVVCEVASFINIRLLGGASLHPLATAAFDQFQFIDRPLVSKENVGALRQAWKDLERQMHEWGNWRMDELDDETSAEDGAA